MLKTLGRQRFVQEILGFVAAMYLGLVRATTRFTLEPQDFPANIGPSLPVIAAMWHGQHFMVHFAWPKGSRVAALISRHQDGEINAIVLRRLGVVAVRGSGGTAAKMRKRGGVAALREMLRELAQGASVVLTADVPKVARQAGAGIVALAQMSGRPIHPIAVVVCRRVDFKSWDRASFPLPFGRGAMVLGPAIHVDRHASPQDLEMARQNVETGLDAAHARAYGMIGQHDPGHGLNKARP